MSLHQNILETIGETPLVRLQKIENAYDVKNELYAKLESFNPSGSVKTRPAYYMLKELRETGCLSKDTTIIEATSGNTGIGLAMVAAYMGNPCILVMPDTLSKERIDTMRLYGAKIILTPGSEGIKGSQKKAEALRRELINAVIPSQFANQENPKAHTETTGPEIVSDMDRDLDYLFVGVGTGGTITGIGRYLKQQGLSTKIIAIEPKTSSVLSGFDPGKHKIQGIGAGFIPEILDEELIDDIVRVSDEDAWRMTKEIPKLEAISAGISSGAALFAAIDYLKKHQVEGKRIVVIFPDAAEKYFSTGVFD